MSKILSYIGFARKARKARTGVNAIATLKGGVPLLILCASASENTVNDALKLQKKLGSKLIVSKEITLEELFDKPNCRLAAITDYSLAKAILDNLDTQFVKFGE